MGQTSLEGRIVGNQRGQPAKQGQPAKKWEGNAGSNRGNHKRKEWEEGPRDGKTLTMVGTRSETTSETKHETHTCIYEREKPASKRAKPQGASRLPLGAVLRGQFRSLIKEMEGWRRPKSTIS